MTTNKRRGDESLDHRTQLRVESLLQNEIELRELHYVHSALAYAGRQLHQGLKGFAQAASLGRAFGESRIGLTLTSLLSMALFHWGLGDGTNALGMLLVMTLSAAALGSLLAALVHSSVTVFLMGETAVFFCAYKLYLLDSLVRAFTWEGVTPAILAGPGLLLLFLVCFQAEEGRTVIGALYAIPAGLVLGTAATAVSLLWGLLGASTRFLWWPLCRHLGFRRSERCLAERTLGLLSQASAARLSVPVRREDFASGCRQAMLYTRRGPVLVDFCGG